jgi:hypothetical protein
MIKIIDKFIYKKNKLKNYFFINLKLRKHFQQVFYFDIYGS